MSAIIVIFDATGSILHSHNLATTLGLSEPPQLIDRVMAPEDVARTQRSIANGKKVGGWTFRCVVVKGDGGRVTVDGTVTKYGDLFTCAMVPVPDTPVVLEPTEWIQELDIGPESRIVVDGAEVMAVRSLNPVAVSRHLPMLRHASHRLAVRQPGARRAWLRRESAAASRPS